jgi:serine/threonine protein phosphatase 1
MIPAPHLSLDLTGFRRVLAVTDIHGEHQQLLAALAAMGYDENLDALVINGDLVDRGPESLAVLDLLERPNIFRAVGNHDIMPQSVLDGDLAADHYSEYGGDWFIQMPANEQREIARRLSNGPIALNIETPAGRNVAFAHADCWIDWSEHVAALSCDQHRLHKDVKRLNLWARDTIEGLFASLKGSGGQPVTYACSVTGVDHVFHGHTTVSRPFAHDNRTWFDTAACYPGGYLTVLDVDAWLDRVDDHRPFQ